MDELYVLMNQNVSVKDLIIVLYFVVVVPLIFRDL